MKVPAKRYDRMKDLASADFERLNPELFIPNTYAVPLPPLPVDPVGRLRGLRPWEKTIMRHEARYARYLRLYGNRIAKDSLLRDDIRYWECRLCGFDANDFRQWFWFCSLRQLRIAEMCRDPDIRGALRERRKNLRR